MWNAIEFAALRTKTSHFPNDGKKVYVEVYKGLGDDNEARWELCEIVMFFDRKFLVFGDYTFPEIYCGELPNEDDYWMLAVSVDFCRNVYTEKEAKAKFPQEFSLKML